MTQLVIADGPGGYWLNKRGYELLGLDWEKEIVAPMERLAPGISKLDQLVGFAYADDRSNEKLVKMIMDAQKRGEIIGNPYLIIYNIDSGYSFDIISDDVGWETVIVDYGG